MSILIGKRYQVSRMDVKIMGPQACFRSPSGPTQPFSGAAPIDRKAIEQREKRILSPHATLSYCRAANDKRAHPEEKDPFRPRFARDRDRIIHSKYFMLLANKTQVFPVLPGLINPITTTRTFHVLRVAQIARTIGRALGLNEDLIEAIALAHDIGHSPFGHAGEYGIREASINDLPRIGKGFRHEWMGLRIVDGLENIEGRIIPGLNLTYEVRDGISRHCGEELAPRLVPSKEYDLNKQALPTTLEGCLVKMIDVVGYVPQDINDFMLAGYFGWADVPADIKAVLGGTIRTMYDTMAKDIINNSIGKKEIVMSERCFQKLNALFKFEMNIINDKLGEQEIRIKADIGRVYNHYKNMKRDPSSIIDHFVRLTDQQMAEEIDNVKKAA